METLKLIIFILLGLSTIFIALSSALGKWNKFNPIIFDIAKFLLITLLGLIVYGFTNIYIGIATILGLYGALQLMSRIGK